MLLFRSEEDIGAWSASTGIGRGAVFDLGRLWVLARTWYDDRLDRGWRRRSPAARQEMLAAAEFSGEFWSIDPDAAG